MGKVEHLSPQEAVKSMASYIRSMQETLEYRLYNLESGNIAEIDASLTPIVVNGEDVNKVIEGVNESLAEVDATVDGFRNTVAQYGKAVEGYEDELELLVSEVGNYGDAVAQYDAQVSTFNQTVAGFTTTVQGYDASVLAYSKELAGLTTQVAGYGQNVKLYEAQVSTFNQTVNGFNTSVQGYNSAVLGYSNELARLTTQVAGYGNAVAQYDAQVTTFSQTVSGFNSTVQGYDASVLGYADQLAALNQQILGYSQDVQEYDAQVSSFNHTVSGFNTTVIGYKSTVDGYTAEYSAMQQTVQGFNATVQGVGDQYAAMKLTVDGLTVTDETSGETLIKGGSIETDTLFVKAANITGELTATRLQGEQIDLRNVEGELCGAFRNILGRFVVAGAVGGMLIFLGTDDAPRINCPGTFLADAIFTTSGLGELSDRDYKNSIEPLPDKYLDMLMNITPRRFKFNNGTSDRYHVGFIAQEVEEVMLAAGIDSQEFGGFIREVDEDGVETCMLRYEEFIAILLAKIKQLEARVAAVGG